MSYTEYQRTLNSLRQEYADLMRQGRTTAARKVLLRRDDLILLHTPAR
jgi:hypothetical protein